MANVPANNIDLTGVISKPWTSSYDTFFNGSLDQDDNPLDEDMLRYNGTEDNYWDNGMTGAADYSSGKHENQEEANALNGETKKRLKMLPKTMLIKNMRVIISMLMMVIIIAIILK